MVIERASVVDAEDILQLQKLAYTSEAQRYNDYAIPPLLQTLEELREDMQHQVFLKAVIDGRIVGSVRAHLSEQTCMVGRLIVDPELQNRGIGTRLMREIELHFDQAGRFELFTGHRSERNLHLYEKLGYQASWNERVSERLTLVFMEKTAGRRR